VPAVTFAGAFDHQAGPESVAVLDLGNFPGTEILGKAAAAAVVAAAETELVLVPGSVLAGKIGSCCYCHTKRTGPKQRLCCLGLHQSTLAGASYHPHSGLGGRRQQFSWPVYLRLHATRRRSFGSFVRENGHEVTTSAKTERLP